MKVYVVVLHRMGADVEIQMVTTDLRKATQKAISNSCKRKEGWSPADVEMLWLSGGDAVWIETHTLEE